MPPLHGLIVVIVVIIVAELQAPASGQEGRGSICCGVCGTENAPISLLLSCFSTSFSSYLPIYCFFTSSSFCPSFHLFLSRYSPAARLAAQLQKAMGLMATHHAGERTENPVTRGFWYSLVVLEAHARHARGAMKCWHRSDLIHFSLWSLQPIGVQE
ncbi:hypothetical protein GGR56DRAFT_511159 [Xylariaceae sp. FL0804]|nr:hypothetical protein GGR56DRAFT_511159 [Xylariaceae sp. FL0804]